MARQKINELFDKFLTDAFDTQAAMGSLIDLQELLIGLSGPSVDKMDDEDLRGLLSKLKAAQKNNPGA